MYIEPNTTIKLIFDCPLDGSYENTLWFETVADQTNYFINTLGGYTLQKNTYQRVNRGVLRVAKSADSIYDCNYMAFKNDNYLNKWFYAFIDKVDYINNVTAEITYHLDLLQTWHFAYQVEQCFVEREHSTTDEIGDNIVDEGLATGEFVSDSNGSVDVGNTGYFIVIWATIDENYDDSYGIKRNANGQWLWSGLTPHIYELTDAGITAASAWIQGIDPTKADRAIVSINIAPHVATNSSGIDNVLKRCVGAYSPMRRTGGNIRNNKLYTYPYNFMYVTNNQGNSAVFRYEFFSIGNNYPYDCHIKTYSDYFSANPTLSAIPLNYKGLTENADERLDLTGFPQISWDVDSYKAWLAQNASSIALSSLTSAIGIAAAEPIMMPSTGSTAMVPSGGIPAGATAGPVTDGGMLLALLALLPMVKMAIQGEIARLMPPQARGQQGSTSLLSLGKLCYTVINKHITEEYATIIDDYFTMYGYACKRVKVPNRSSRPEWNYVKTIGCKIRGSMPSDDAVAIEKIYDNGIRFWKNPGHIGNYTFDNSPVVVPDNPNVPSEG